MNEKTLCFLQNQWQPDADYWNQKYAQMAPDFRMKFRLRIITGYVCTGRSLTACRLQEAFGDMLEQMLFENASPIVGSKATDKFPADLDHMKQVIDHVQPIFIVAFGAVARDGLAKIWPGFQALNLPHPVARQLEPGEWRKWRKRVQHELEIVKHHLRTPPQQQEYLSQQFPPGTRVQDRYSGETGTVLEVLPPDGYDDVWIRVSWDSGIASLSEKRTWDDLKAPSEVSA